MSSDVLSAEEIDSLLTALSEGEIDIDEDEISTAAAADSELLDWEQELKDDIEVLCLLYCHDAVLAQRYSAAMEVK